MEVWWEESATSNHSYLKIYVRNLWLPIHISHGFASKLHILHKSDNILVWAIAYTRYDRPDNVQFMKSWERYAVSFDAGLTSFEIWVGIQFG